MKKSKLIKMTLLINSVIFSHGVYAQENVAELAQIGPDAEKLASAYLSPLFKGLGVGLNSGWANTAHSKNLGKFDLRFTLSGAIVPGKDERFDVSTLGLSNNVRLKAGESPLSPTVAGVETEGPIMEIYQNNIKVEELNLPQGANVPFIPTPQIQATVGLPKGIDVTLRAIPTINMGDVGALNMIGGGIKFEILPLFVGKTAGKVLPFDLAVALGYSQVSYKKDLDYTSPDGTSLPDNQTIEARVSGLNVQTILSKKLLAFTPFLALGYNTSKTSGGLKGDYRVITGADPITQSPVYSTKIDPVSLDRDNFDGFRTDLGFQLNLAFFRIYAAYSIAEYNSVNAGIGFGIGK